MSCLLGDNVPKLLPIFHDVSVVESQNSIRYPVFRTQKIPDCGGAGADIVFDSGQSQCEIVKHHTIEEQFCAQSCSLPMFPPSGVVEVTDTCIEPLVNAKQNYERFCRRLIHCRAALNRKVCKYSKDLYSSLLDKLESMDMGETQEDFRVPAKLVDMCKCLPETHSYPDANYDFVGGCLSLTNHGSSNPILLYPTGKKLNSLAVVPLEEQDDIVQNFKPCDMKKKTVKLKGGAIYQISSACDGYCFVRQHTRCHFIHFGKAKDDIYQQCVSKACIVSCIAASPYNPMNYSTSYEDGRIELYNMNSSDPVWSTDKLLQEDLSINSSLSACEFGSHPFSILHLNTHHLHCFDTRIKEKCSTILSSSAILQHQTFAAAKSFVANPFQICISSTNHLIIVDERYPGKPMQVWNHAFSNPPLYINCVPYSSKPNLTNSTVLLASQKNGEICSFITQTRPNFIHPVSRCPPMYVSSPTDAINTLKLHCHDISEAISKRIEYPIIGIGLLPHTDREGFTTFQVTLSGDVFYQDFEKDVREDVIEKGLDERTFRVDMGCVLAPPELIVPHFENWKDVEESDDKQKEVKGLKRINAMLNWMFKPCAPLPSCKYCRRTVIESEDTKSLQLCKSCNLNMFESTRFSQAFENLELLSGCRSETSDLSDIDISSLSAFDDEYSKKMLRVWTLENYDLDRSPTPDYNTDGYLSSTSASSIVSKSSTGSRKTLETSQTYPEPMEISSTRESFLMQDTSTMYISQGDSFTESMNDIVDSVPPSQAVRPLVGETIRMSSTPARKNTARKSSSQAGF